MSPQATELRCPRCGFPVHFRCVEVFTTKTRIEVSRFGEVREDDEIRAGPSRHRRGLRIHLVCENDMQCTGRSVLSIAEQGGGPLILKVGTDPGERLDTSTLTPMQREA